MKFLLRALPIVFWVVTLSAAQNTPLTFVPLGIDLSVNEHLAKPGVAEKSINFLCDERLALHKRPGYAVWSTGVNGVSVSGQYTSIYPFHANDGGKRLFGTFLFDDSTSTFKGAPYSLILKSGEFGRNIAAANAYPFNYYDEPINCATYNNTMFIGRKYGRPLRFHGNVAPLVEPPPGTWEYTPMAETTSTTNLLNGKYWYAMRAKVYVWVQIGAWGWYPIYIGYPDSLNLKNLSYEIQVDSDWVFVHSPEMRTTSRGWNYEATTIQICRTRADREPTDSFFLVGETTVYDTSTMLSFHFIDSVKDASLGVFCGFVDTVYRTLDTANVDSTVVDSANRLGCISWKSTKRISTGNAFKGIAHGYDQIIDTSWQATLYAIAYYDSATGAVSPIGTIGRIPVAYRGGTGSDSIFDSALHFYIPPIPQQKHHLWRLICRAYEERTKVTFIDTSRMDWIPASLIEGDCGDNPCYYYTCWDDAGNPTTTNLVYRISDGSRWCSGALVKIRRYDTSTYYSQFRIIDTIKSNTDTTYWDSIGSGSVPFLDTTDCTGACDSTNPYPIYSDTMSWPSWLGKPLLVSSGYIGALNYPVVFNDRVLMASRDNRVYFSYWGEYTSELAVYRDWDNFSVNLDNGDEITGQIVWGNADYIFQNNAIFRATEAGKDNYNVETYQTGIGCIAPKTLQHVPGGGIVFLHTSGLQVISGPLQSQYKESGGTISPSISGPIQVHLDSYGIDDLREALIWFDEGEKNMWLSFPTLDTSFVLDASGQWHQQTIAPKMVVVYDTAYSADARPDKRRVFILDGESDLYKYGGVDTDNGDSILLEWKSHLMYSTGDMGKITEFKLWKHSDDDNGIDFNVYNILDTGVVATVRDSTIYRVKRKDINCPESEGFKIELKTYADSLTIDRIDLQYELTGPMPVD